MPDRFTYRLLPNGRQSAKKLWATAGSRVAAHLFGKGPVRLEYDGEKYDKRLSVPEAMVRVRSLLKRKVTDRVVMHPSKGRAVALRRWHVEKKVPLPEIDATLSLRKIYGAVNAKFKPMWEVRNMGIGVDKPGEHGTNPPNAWDIGTSPGVPAPVTWARIEAYAKYLRAQGIAHKVSGGRLGLPVNGVIYQDRFWQRGMGLTWAHYSGTRHVSHVHVSGYPSKTGWI